MKRVHEEVWFGSCSSESCQWQPETSHCNGLLRPQAGGSVDGGLHRHVWRRKNGRKNDDDDQQRKMLRGKFAQKKLFSICRVRGAESNGEGPRLIRATVKEIFAIEIPKKGRRRRHVTSALTHPQDAPVTFLVGVAPVQDQQKQCAISVIRCFHCEVPSCPRDLVVHERRRHLLGSFLGRRENIMPQSARFTAKSLLYAR